MHTCMSSEPWVRLMLECVFVYGVAKCDSVRPVCLKMKFVLWAGRAVRENTEVGRSTVRCGLEADEGGIDLAYTRQRQHDLSPVLRVLL